MREGKLFPLFLIDESKFEDNFSKGKEKKKKRLRKDEKEIMLNRAFQCLFIFTFIMLTIQWFIWCTYFIHIYHYHYNNCHADFSLTALSIHFQQMLFNMHSHLYSRKRERRKIKNQKFWANSELLTNQISHFHIGSWFHVSFWTLYLYHWIIKLIESYSKW